METVMAPVPRNVSDTPVSVLLHRADSMRWSWELYPLAKVLYMLWVISFSVVFTRQWIVPLFEIEG